MNSEISFFFFSSRSVWKQKHLLPFCLTALNSGRHFGIAGKQFRISRSKKTASQEHKLHACKRVRCQFLRLYWLFITDRMLFQVRLCQWRRNRWHAVRLPRSLWVFVLRTNTLDTLLQQMILFKPARHRKSTLSTTVLISRMINKDFLSFTIHHAVNLMAVYDIQIMIKWYICLDVYVVNMKTYTWKKRCCCNLDNG